MNKLPRTACLLFTALFVISAIGCAGMQKEAREDPYKASMYAYSKALKWFTESAETYDMHYQAADEIARANWKRDINPIFKEIKEVLDKWKQALNSGEPEEDFDVKFTRLKKSIILYGLTFLE